MDSGHFEESGSDDEFLIANEGYPEDGEHNNNRDFFSLPTLGLNYLNNLNLSLNLSLNLRNSQLWRIYENSTFTKPGFLANYLGKHSEELDLHEHGDISPETRGYFTLTNFLRRHGFPSYEEDYSEEAILERVRLKKLQQQAQVAATRTQERFAENEFISAFEENLEEPRICNEKVYGECLDFNPRIEEDVVKEEKKLSGVESKPQCEVSAAQQEMPANADVSTAVNPFYNRVELSFWDKLKV